LIAGTCETGPDSIGGRPIRLDKCERSLVSEMRSLGGPVEILALTSGLEPIIVRVFHDRATLDVSPELVRKSDPAMTDTV